MADLVGHLVSVNVGTPKPAPWASGRATEPRISIDRRPVEGPVRVHRLGLAGDQVANPRFHGGEEKALYAFAAEDLEHWAHELGRPVPPGHFGENLTTSGLDVNAAEVGSRWRVGTALLEVASFRTPCGMFRSWQAHTGYPARGWLKRFTEVGRPGPYLRVLEEGEVTSGDRIEVVHEPGHGVSVSTMFRAATTEPALLADLVDVPGLPDELRRRVRRHLASHAGS